MFKRAILVLLVIVSLSAVTFTVFAISDNDKTVYSEKPSIISPNSGIVTLTDSLEYKTADKYTNLRKTISPRETQIAEKYIKEPNLRKIISPREAQIIAEKYIKEPGVTSGTPKLVKEEGKQVYIVPVLDNQKDVGEIHLDARNGKNLEGCGGAP